MTALAKQHCAPCKGEENRLSDALIEEHLMALSGWELQGNAIHKKIELKNFIEALALVNKIGEVAEAEGHHPDFTLGWGYVGITMTTHDCGGLSENDMIMAAKIEELIKV